MISSILLSRVSLLAQSLLVVSILISPKLTTPFQQNTILHSVLIPHGTTTQSTSLFLSSDHLLDDFKTVDGEVVNPYRILKIERKAEKDVIKKAYWTQSKRYHPDMAKKRDILPGSCDNLEEVRDEWEKVKLSYEILKNKKKRIKYDRNSALNDPSAAIGRAAIELLGWSIKGVGVGVFEMGKGFAKVGGEVLFEKGKAEKANEKSVQTVKAGP